MQKIMMKNKLRKFKNFLNTDNSQTVRGIIESLLLTMKELKDEIMNVRGVPIIGGILTSPLAEATTERTSTPPIAFSVIVASHPIVGDLFTNEASFDAFVALDNRKSLRYLIELCEDLAKHA